MAVCAGIAGSGFLLAGTGTIIGAGSLAAVPPSFGSSAVVGVPIAAELVAQGNILSIIGLGCISNMLINASMGGDGSKKQRNAPPEPASEANGAPSFNN